MLSIVDLLTSSDAAVMPVPSSPAAICTGTHYGRRPDKEDMECILHLLVDALNLGFPFFCDAGVVVCKEIACNDGRDTFRRGRCPLTTCPVMKK